MKNHKNLLERIELNESNFNEFCKEKSNLNNKRQSQESK